MAGTPWNTLLYNGYLSLNEPYAAAAAKSLQSCLTLCDPIDGSQPGSPVPGILQARTLEWVAISFSNAWKWKVKVKLLSRVRLLATPWIAAHQAPPSMGFSRQEYWSGVPLPSPTREAEVLPIPTSSNILSFHCTTLSQLLLLWLLPVTSSSCVRKDVLPKEADTFQMQRRV